MVSINPAYGLQADPRTTCRSRTGVVSSTHKPIRLNPQKSSSLRASVAMSDVHAEKLRLEQSPRPRSTYPPARPARLRRFVALENNTAKTIQLLRRTK